MKTNDKITTVAKEFLKAFDAEDLVGRKKNLVRAVDSFCYVLKCEMYIHMTLNEVSDLVNDIFKKNKKSYLHSDVINAIRRHKDRMCNDFNGDVYYQDVYLEVMEKLRDNGVIKTTYHEKTETQK